MDPEIANIIVGVLIMVGCIVGGGAISASISELAKALTNND